MENMENKNESSSSTSTSLSTSSSPPRYSENLPMPHSHSMELELELESDKETEGAAGLDCQCRKRNLLNASKMEKQRQNEEIATTAAAATELTKGACFIDASSLLDEDELLARQAPLPQSNSSSSCNSEPGEPAIMLQKNLTTTTTTSSSSNNNINNLSDEEKLWKRHQHKQTPAMAGSAVGAAATATTLADDDTEASISLASENIHIKYSQQQQPSLKTITYTTLPLSMSPKFNTFKITTTTTTTSSSMSHHNNIFENDLCYTTDYSSSSPAPSLVWSQQDKRATTTTAHNMNNYNNLMYDTPHNSIVNIEHIQQHRHHPHTNNNSSNYSTLSSSLSQQRDSGAFCMDSPISLPSTPKPAYKMAKEQKQLYTSQEEEEEARGGVAAEHEKELIKPIALSASWIVDMSDCRRQSIELSNSLTTTTTTTAIRERERCDSGSSLRSNRSCGFYVPLSINNSKIEQLETSLETSSTNNEHLYTKSYTGLAKQTKAKSFFINLSQSDTQVIDQQADEKKREEEEEDKRKLKSERNDKKSIFSLFIDIGGDKKKEFPAQLAQRLIGGTNNSSSSSSNNNKNRLQMTTTATATGGGIVEQQQPNDKKSSNSSTETLMSKSANFKKQQQQQHDVEDDDNNDIIINKRQKKIIINDNKRHSWNERPSTNNLESYNNNNNNHNNNNNQYKRSISLTTTKGDKDGLMSIIDKLSIIQQQQQQQKPSLSQTEILSSCTESLSLSSSIEEQNKQQQQRQKVRQRDVAINQTYDVCSLASITDSLLSKDPSPISTADTDDLTFQQDEELATLELETHQPPPPPQQPQPIDGDNLSNSNNRMETILETKETPPIKHKSSISIAMEQLSADEEEADEKVDKLSISKHNMDTLHATIEKQKMLLETVNEHSEVLVCGAGRGAFVKLSDLDKPLSEETTTLFNEHKNPPQQQQQRAFNRSSNIGRPHSWTHSNNMTRSSLLNITSSMENLRSLTRLFPHFSKEISNSLPNDVTSLQEYSTANTDATSNDSSMASSFSRSGMDESSISCRQPRRLGEDLLKMFLQEIATDMIVEVHGRRIRAHKCILRSRCQYFAAVLAGNESQSIVSLQGYSHSAVHFALCHIYSGASHPPDGVSLMELAALADLMGLEGLKEVTAHALKINYCHNFHKPCAGCIDGILQVLPVALNHALDDLYRKCLRWTCRYYLKVWATRQFCQLPSDILGRCRQQIIAYLSSETVLDTLLECETLLLHMSNCSWGGVCESLARDIIDASHNFIAGHFASLIASDAFLSLGNDRSENIPQLEDVLLRIASTLNAEQACRSYQRVTRLNTVLEGNALDLHANLGALAKELQGLQDEDLDWNPEFIRLVSEIMCAVEQCLVRQCSRAMRVTAWQRMDLNLRKKIQALAHLTDPGLDIKRGRALPKHSSYSVGGGSRNQDLYQVKLAIQAHSRRANSHDVYLLPAVNDTRTIIPPPKTIERGVQATSTMDTKNTVKAKILKSNSRSYVPQPVRNNNVQRNQKNSEANMHPAYRRTQSTQNAGKKLVQQRVAALESSTESIAVKTTKKMHTQGATVPVPGPRLSDVRPRYLEPRKVYTQPQNNGPVRSATSSSIPSGSTKIKLPQMSSSHSSRHSSPAAVKKSQSTTTAAATATAALARNGTAGGGTHSAHRSYDSLTTPPVRGKSNNSSITSKLSDNDHQADSQSNTTISSHKSFKEMGKFSRSNPLMGKKKHLSQQKPQQPQRLSTGSSPSSIGTSKSAASRLSSVSSSQSSRDIYKQRSISMSTGQQQQQQQQKQMQQQQQRYSFLSAKSREILAKRAEKNKIQAEVLKRVQQQKQKQQQIYTDNDNVFEDDNDEVELRIPSLRSHNSYRLSTSVPAARPNSLNLRKNNNTNSCTTAAAAATNNYKLLKVKTNNQQVPSTPPSLSPTPSQVMSNSNMERSNTFCKDSPALDINHMQIID